MSATLIPLHRDDARATAERQQEMTTVRDGANAAARDASSEASSESSMRLFLVALMLVYGIYGALFLLVPTRLTATHAGAWFTSHGPASQVWGILFLLAACLVNASLIWPGRARLCAAGVLFALFVGGAWATAGCAITLFYGADPSQPIVWLWLTFMVAFTFVQLSPRTRPAWRSLSLLPHVLVTGAGSSPTTDTTLPEDTRPRHEM